MKTAWTVTIVAIIPLAIVVLVAFFRSARGKQVRERIKAEVLKHLLLDVQRNNCRWHDVVLPVIRGTVSHWAPEVVVTRQGENGLEIYLAGYEGGIPELQGTWNIPGSHHKNGEDVQQGSSRVALQQLGCDVEVIDVIDERLWQKGKEHPQGYPLSLYVLCRPWGEVRIDDTHGFFGRDELPEGLNSVHREFAMTLLSAGSVEEFLRTRTEVFVRRLHGVGAPQRNQEKVA